MHSPSPLSDRKLQANRANALKSTGPKSDEGKARSARNAIRHGLLAEAASLLAEPNHELQALLDRYQADFRPASVHEEMLVRELALADWRLRQSSRIESGLMSVTMQQAHKSLFQADEPDPETAAAPPSLAETSPELRTALLGVAWVNFNSTFALLMRYQNQARRDYFRALKQLELLRTGKAGYLPAQPSADAAQDETKPTAAAPQPAAAPALDQTNPNSPVPGFPHIPTTEDLRRLLGPLDDEFPFVRTSK